MFSRFNYLIDPFASDRLDQPPLGLLAFYWRYIGQIWRWFVVAIVTGGALAIVNAVFFAYIGILIDRLGLASDPGAFFSENAGLLIWIALLVLIVEPVLVTAHMAVTNQTLSPALTGLIRWQTHRYLLRQSVAFFENDFAGRLANKVMQTSIALRRSFGEMIDAVWYVSVFWVSAAVILATLDVLVALPLLLWLALYGGGVLWYFVPRCRRRPTRRPRQAPS